MSYTYLQDRGGVSSAECFSDIPQSVLSNLGKPEGTFYSNGSSMESCPGFPSGTMSQPLTEHRGEEESMLFAGDSHVRTLAKQEKSEDSQARNPPFGMKCGELLAKYDPATSLWRTHQNLLFEEQQELLEIWPQWAMWDEAGCWELIVSDFLIEDPVCGWLPTPNGVPSPDNHMIGRLDEWSGRNNLFRGMEAGKKFYAWFEEDMMGFPPGWTGQEPLEMHKFQQWLRSHGKYFQER